MCESLDEQVRAASPDDRQALEQRRMAHRSLHVEVMLLRDRMLKPPIAARYRDPVWADESGRRILREPEKGDCVASQIFFVLHRHRFGQFVRAVLDEHDDEARLRLLDDRGQILELRGTLAGYRGQSPRATI